MLAEAGCNAKSLPLGRGFPRLLLADSSETSVIVLETH